MDVRIEPMQAVIVTTKKPITLSQMRIRVDGVQAGYVKNAAGAKVCMIRRYTPAQLDEIQTKVAQLLERPETDIAQAPDVPETMRQDIRKQGSELAQDGDFD